MPVDQRLVRQLRGQRMTRPGQHLGPEPRGRCLGSITAGARRHDRVDGVEQLLDRMNAYVVAHQRILPENKVIRGGSIV